MMLHMVFILQIMQVCSRNIINQASPTLFLNNKFYFSNMSLFEISITYLPAITEHLNANISHKLTSINKGANISVDANFVIMQP